MLRPFDEAENSAWYESHEARIWAQTTLSTLLPPALHSEARRRVIESIESDIEKITSLCIDSFWKTDDDGRMNREAEALKISVLQKKAIVSPWRLLAPELLSSIFVLVTDHDESRDNTYKGWANREMGQRHLVSGHRVSQVSRHWRNIALYTPQCWAPLIVKGHTLHLRLLELWLARSGNIAVDIRIATCLDKSQRDYYKLLRKHVRRWRTLQVRIDHDWSSKTRTDVQKGLLEQCKRGTQILSVDVNGTHSTRYSVSGSPPMINANDMPSSAKKLSHPILYKRMRAGSRETNMLPYSCVVGCLGTHERNEVTNRWELRELNLEHAIEAGGVNDKDDSFVDISTVRTVTLPSKWEASPYVEVQRMDDLLEQLSIGAPMITTLRFPNYYDFFVLPPMHSLTSIRISKISSNHDKFQMAMWCDATPNLRYLAIGEFLWIEVRALETCMEDIYALPQEDDFAWEKLDQAHVYAWRDRWCLCFAKRGPLAFLVEHPISKGHYLSEVRGMDFPYKMDLSWRELGKRIDAVRDYHAMLRGECDDNDVAMLF